MLQPLLMLLVTSASQKRAPLQGYTLNLTCNVHFSLLQNTLTIFHYTILMQVPQSLLQNVSHIIGNLETAYDLFDGREVNCILIELMEIVKLCFNHLSMLLFLGYPHCDIHACQEMNLIQQHKLDLHICIFHFGLHLLNSKR
jgi:hypothetical protein